MYFSANLTKFVGFLQHLMKKRRYSILFWVTVVATVIFTAMIPLINVNNDMTKYLPDSSRMKEGVDIISSEFADAMEMAGGDVKVMLKSGDSQEKTALKTALSSLEEVSGVTVTESADSLATLYDLVVSKSVNQKMLGKSIRQSFSNYDIIVETSQDGATPPFSVIVIAAILVVVLLLVTARSWFDPLVCLISVGMAVGINMGTNALLPSVSITTNYIEAILQLVLSLDYSIILINRFRQEYAAAGEPLAAVGAAVRKAAPSILSSALTTVVGLLMLVFMRLKIGMDMGVVLAKGVIFSLICTFTALPALLLFFHKGINTYKKTLYLPTERLARFSTRYRIPLASSALILFAAALLLSQRTDVFFNTNGESVIGRTFPQKNTFVLLYDTTDEMEVIPLADKLESTEGVNTFISYPTILKEQFTAEGLVKHFKALAEDFGAAAGASQADLDMLSPDLLKAVFYLNSGKAEDLKVSFPDIMDFISDQSESNPLLASAIDAEMKEKLSLLKEITSGEDDEVPQPQAAEKADMPAEPAARKADMPAADPQPQAAAAAVALQPVAIRAAPPAPDGISLIRHIRFLHRTAPGGNTATLNKLVDTLSLKKRMPVDEMSKFIGSTMYQTKMVYSFSKSADKKLTPMEYVHFLADDLFHRKALARFVSAEQKEGLLMWKKVMDFAMADAHISKAEMAEILKYYGITDIDEKAAAEPQPAPSPVQQAKPAETLNAEADTVLAAQKEHPEAVPVQTAAPAPKPKHAPSADEIFMDLMSSGRKFTAAQMAGNFKRLGENIDPSLVKMLYAFYGSSHDYDESLTMSVEELLDCVDALLSGSDLPASVSEQALSSFSQARSSLADGLGQLRGKDHSMAVLMTDFPVESDRTFEFVKWLDKEASSAFKGNFHFVGESVMLEEMDECFSDEVRLITILTVAAIFLIVAIFFKSVLIPAILVMTIMTAVYVNVFFSGIFSNGMLYLAYLIVQSILMGATIDYGILFTNYYLEKRRTLSIEDSVKEAYSSSIRTIMTSGLIIVLAPGVMTLMVTDPTISAILGSISAGAAASVFLIMFVLPGTISALDRFIVKKQKSQKYTV